jgi:hypothetical protein
MPPKPDLTSDQRKQIVSQLLLLIKDGVAPPELKRGALKQVATNFNVQARTITTIWRRACQNYADPTIGTFSASPLKKKNCGRKQKYDRDEVRAAILLVPTHRRMSMRKLASAIGIGKTTMHRMKIDKEDNVIVPHSNAVECLAAHQKASKSKETSKADDDPKYSYELLQKKMNKVNKMLREVIKEKGENCKDYKKLHRKRDEYLLALEEFESSDDDEDDVEVSDDEE